MTFKKFNKKIKKQFDKMSQTGKLFRANVSGDELWKTYLDSFINKTIFRDPTSSDHNCKLCNNFIRRYGNIVAINDEGELESLFTNLGDVGEFTNSAKALDELITNSKIKDVFFETYEELNDLPYEKNVKKSQNTFKLGVEKNHKQYTQAEAYVYPKTVKVGEIYEFNHFNIDLPEEFVDQSGKSIEKIMSEYRDKYHVFKRAMEEIPLDTLNLVKDLINQGSLLDGTAHLHAVEEMIKFKQSSHEMVDTMGYNTDNYYWEVTYNMDEYIAKFKNNLIGVLCTELAEGMDLNKACENWNKRVDPINYHKATAPITQRQIKEAQKFVEENDYVKSFDRRLATIDDIKADEILHMNVGDGGIKSASIFDNVKPSGEGRHKRSKFDNVEEVSIDKFMKDILPNCTSVEALLENKMAGNLCVLTKAVDNDSKPIFKWSNNYSWTFNGNLAGKSQIKDAVKSRGGGVDGVVNIRLHFPDTERDYDLHAIGPYGEHIYYNNVRRSHPSTGVLDLDAQGVDGHYSPDKRVENITYNDKSKMPDGTYTIKVNDYSKSRFPAGFYIEVEIEGDITTMRFDNYKEKTINNQNVCEIILQNGNFELKPDANMTVVSSESVSKEMWGLDSNEFHKINLVCLSPNHWGDNKVGNLHYMFMLEGCKAEGNIRSFHNENLIPELLKHKKVMEVLGSTNMIEPKGKYLAGLGFNSTMKDGLIVRCKGTFNRMLKIKF